MNAGSWVWIFALLHWLARGLMQGSHMAEYCPGERFNATCPQNESILMQEAQFGRMRKGRCLHVDYYIGCTINAIGFVDWKCSGKQTCSFDVLDSDLFSILPCRNDLAGYLETTYTCVPASSMGSRSCRTEGKLVVNVTQPGYLSNVFGSRSGHISSSCPIVLTTTPGRSINLTLYDFSIWSRSRPNSNEGAFDGDCVGGTYAIVRERVNGAAVSVCGQTERVKHIIVSKSHQVEIQLVTDDQTNKAFMIKYEAIGCASPTVPTSVHVDISGNKATLTCSYSNESWTLICRQTAWVGQMKNCSRQAEGSHQNDKYSEFSEPFPFGLMIAISTGVVFGILLGSFLLFVVLRCQKKRRTIQQNEAKRRDVYLLREADDRRPHPYTDEPCTVHIPKTYETCPLHSSDYGTSLNLVYAKRSDCVLYEPSARERKRCDLVDDVQSFSDCPIHGTMTCNHARIPEDAEC